ncbi:hypothetical protein [Paracidovorax konjaci]|uniref:Uncharacterized protein n=1 Tax=Paracidovorax konjaci TaxID=32040 RepID=A0A1I1ZN47_9BURK|nr:hypothetical protein [Paracidovorax konjaci]SFE32778.1 hypothetical protein SAMN04489710_1316 [Paracidovorax konjaci]
MSSVVVEVIGMKAFKGFVNKEGINSGALFGRVKLDDRYNKPGENFKGGYSVEEWKMPDADTIFRMQHIPTPFMCALDVERVSNGRETKEMVVGARPIETVKAPPAEPAKPAVAQPANDVRKVA